MATHSGTLAWEIPWTKEPGRLPSMGLQRVGHDWGLTIVNHTPRAQKGVLLLPHRQGYAPLSHPFHSSMNNNRGCNRICPPPHPLLSPLGSTGSGSWPALTSHSRSSAGPLAASMLLLCPGPGFGAGPSRATSSQVMWVACWGT